VACEESVVQERGRSRAAAPRARGAHDEMTTARRFARSPRRWRAS
jgi:hypothetical protein